MAAVERKSSNEELAQRVTAIEDRLGMDADPPLDRLSTIEFKGEGLRDLLNHQGITLGDHGRSLTRLEAVQLQHGRALVDLKSDMSLLTTDVAVIKTDVGVLKTDVAILQTNMAVLHTDVSKLNTNVSKINIGLSELTTGLSQTNAGVQTILALLTAGPRG